jgi:hypothetical protein
VASVPPTALPLPRAPPTRPPAPLRNAGKSALPGKHHHWGQLQSSKQRGNLSDAELAELRALERVGSRRRTRYLNDKVLRDMAGIMTAGDMEVRGVAGRAGLGRAPWVPHVAGCGCCAAALLGA